MTPTPSVFISYSSKDKALVHPLADWLMNQGFGVWIDRDQIRGGQYFGTEIVRGIDGAKAFLLMCSPNSMKSEVVFYEVAYSVTAGVHKRFPIWLTPVTGNPSDHYPPRIRLVLPFQCIFTADQLPAMWYGRVRDSLLREGIPANFLGPEPASPEQYSQAVAERNWGRVVRLGESLLRQYPGHPELIQGVANARAWMEAEQAALLARLAGNPTPDDWEDYLIRQPEGSLADHAKFRLAGSLPVPRLGSFLARCASGGTVAWQIAEAITRLRLKDRNTARQILDRLRVSEPVNTAVAYFSAVVRVASVGLSHISLELLAPVNELLTLCWQLSATCGYPSLLAEQLAREYYERRQLRGPFGTSQELRERAFATGLTLSDVAELLALLSR